MRHYQVQALHIKVDLVVMAMKRYSTLSRPVEQEHTLKCHIQDTSFSFFFFFFFLDGSYPSGEETAISKPHGQGKRSNYL